MDTPPNDNAGQPKAKPRVRLPKLKASDFQHPLDVAALNALKQAKGLDFVVRKLNEYGFERWHHINNIADNVRVSPRQCKRIHDMLREACDILGVPEPQLYLDQNPTVNAFTFGTERPFIVLHSGLVDFLTDDELLCVIAHELGHIKCGHVLYKMMANFLSVVVEMIGEATLGIGSLIGSGLLLALYEWDRKSELSSDRAGLLVVQDPNVSITTLMKLAGGSQKIFEQLDRDEFLKQADEYRELDSSFLNQVYKFLQVYQRTHPFPALRAKELKMWAEIGAYQSIVDGSYWVQYLPPSYSPPSSSYEGGAPPRSPFRGPNVPIMPVCPSCGAVQADPYAAFCMQCGSPMSPADAPASKEAAPTCIACGATVTERDLFCPVCGVNLRLG
jgi:Zn-dependent protease with chaperone function